LGDIKLRKGGPWRVKIATSKMKPIKKFLIAILVALGAVMLFLGVVNSMLPPALTGVGFCVIALLFLIDAK
jgi:hypothetical protein